MTLLDFARGPAIEVALAVFCFGVLWRLFSLFLLPWMHDRSAPRRGAPPAAVGAIKGFLSLMWTSSPHSGSALFTKINGYIFHAGLAIVVFGMAQHIVFFKGLFGIQWPNLPTGVISVVAIITLASLFVALVRRIANPVTRLLSTFNDYFSWLVTMLPVVTGVIAVDHFWEPYEALLAIHILSVCALLIWFPFGKLMHAFLIFVTRGETGIFYSRRGVEI